MVISNKITNVHILDPGVTFLRIHYPNILAHRQNKVGRKLIIASLFALAKDWEESKCPSVDNLLNILQ